MAIIEQHNEKLNGMEWTSIMSLEFELSNLKGKKQPSNQEQVVIDWMKERINTLNARKG
ncbi:hypothetical protein N9I00_01825 [bacterium]|nr:hypothetical protein [bacterium]